VTSYSSLLTEPSAIAAAVAVGVAAILIALVASLWKARRAQRRLAALEAELATFRVAISDATETMAACSRVEKRVRRLDQVTARMDERLGKLEVRGEGRPYDQAIAAVQDGGDSDRLVRNFGLSRGEADLIALMHGRRKAG